jgi:hypothetical protein
MSKTLEFHIRMPEPTHESPHAQLDWIFTQKSALYDKKSTRGNFRGGLAFYKKFLRETNNYNPLLNDDPRFRIRCEWDALALHKIKQWLDATNIAGTENYLASSTLSGHISAIRITMEYAYEHS